MSDAKNQTIEPTMQQRPAYIEKFDEWKLYQKQCPFAGGQGRLYCKFGGHPCAFKLCPVRLYDNEYTISVMVSDEINAMKNQLKRIETMLKQLIEKDG